MRKLLPYLIITLIFGLYIFLFHKDSLNYKFNPSLVHNYLRSQDIEDPQGLIKDRISVSDSDIYIATGYLYAKGENPTKYNFQHPPLIKYLFGFSTLLTGNPYWVQFLFGLGLLFLTYFLGTLRLRSGPWLPLIPPLLLLIDPVFGGMMNQALLDLGNAVLGLGFTVLIFFFPEAYILQGIALGLFAASKFWSTAIVFVALIFGYKIFIKKEKMNYGKVAGSFLVAFIVFSLTYIVSFIRAGGIFNIIAYQARVLRFMLNHNLARSIGGSVILFMTGYFAPWWQAGVTKAGEWSILWPVGLASSIIMAIRTRLKDQKFLFYVLPAAYLLLTVTQVPFTRYFIIILPLVYLSLSSLLTG